MLLSEEVAAGPGKGTAASEDAAEYSDEHPESHQPPPDPDRINRAAGVFVASADLDRFNSFGAELERDAIAAILLRTEDGIRCAGARPEHFADPRGQLIVKALAAAEASGEPDLARAVAILRGYTDPAAAAALAVASEVIERQFAPAMTAGEAVRELKAHAARRDVLAAAVLALGKVIDPAQEISEAGKALGEAQRKAAAIASSGGTLAHLRAGYVDDHDLALDEPGLVDGLLDRTGLTVMFGESGVGKTFAAIGLACHVAAGRSWHGLDVERGAVLYIAAEAPASAFRRVHAWKIQHGVTELPIAITQAGVNLCGQADIDAAIALARQVEADHGRVGLVVVDTLARAMRGDENSAEIMGGFVEGVAQIAAAVGAHGMIVHHSGKDTSKGARGSYALKGAVDVELEVNGADGLGTIRANKVRDGKDGQTFGFKLQTVELGVNSKGRTVTTCVAVASDASDTRPARRPLGGNERIVFDALVAAINDHGTPPPLAHDIPSRVKGVTVEQWREAACRYLPQPEAKRRVEAFSRALSSLVAAGYVRQAGGFAWLP